MYVGAVTSVTWCHAEHERPVRAVVASRDVTAVHSFGSANPYPAATDRAGESFWIATFLIKFPVLRARRQ